MFIISSDIIDILHEAGRAAMSVYADEATFGIETKSDQSPVTEADKRSNTIIIDHLTRFYPGIPVISEESQQLPYEERKNFNRFFLVDPLDGTKEFIRRNGEFTINIAYFEDDHLSAGFVGVPASNQIYFAEKGKGAFRLDGNSRQYELRTVPFYLHQPGLKVVASRSHMDPETSKIIDGLQNPELIATGSALKFLRIAEGAAHFYPRLGPTMEWDTAAAQCILEESGGSVISLPGLMPMMYNKENLLNPHFLAFGALLDPEMLQELIPGTGASRAS
jgi:3'(2'), 5'-bisphosphate nucleotidase